MRSMNSYGAQLFHRFPDMTGKNVVEHHFETEAQPILQQPYQFLWEKMKAEVIEASSVVLVENKDGDLRFCINYWKINDVEEVLESVGLALIFFTLEKLWPSQLESSNLIWCLLAYKSHQLPFKEWWNEVLKKCHDFAGTYIDDVIYSKMWMEHLPSFCVSSESRTDTKEVKMPN